jgi:hypothetical protein
MPGLTTKWIPLSGHWRIVDIMTAVFLVGLIHHFTLAKQMNLIDAVDEFITL